MKRYDLEFTCDEGGDMRMEQSNNGDWVAYDDVANAIEVLRQVRASILGWQPDEPTPMRHQMALALRRINDVLYAI